MLDSLQVHFSSLLYRVVVKKNKPGFFKKAHLRKTIKPTKKPTLQFSFEKYTNK